MGRAPCCEKTGLKKGKWTVEEDEKLANYIKANGEGLWRSLPKNAGLSRCGKSCRLRWINYLREDVKRGNFTANEEETIVKLHKSLGNRNTVRKHTGGPDVPPAADTASAREAGERDSDPSESERLMKSSSSLSSCDLPLHSAFMPIPSGPWAEVDEETLMNINHFMEENEVTDNFFQKIPTNDDNVRDSCVVTNNTDSGTTTSDGRNYYTENTNLYTCSLPIVSYFNDEVFGWDQNSGAILEEVVDLWSEKEEEEEEGIWIWS